MWSSRPSRRPRRKSAVRHWCSRTTTSTPRACKAAITQYEQKNRSARTMSPGWNWAMTIRSRASSLVCLPW